MASETIVAVFDTAVHAQTAISDLISQGVPSGAIEHSAQEVETIGATGGAPIATTYGAADTGKHHGLWAWLTGEFETATPHHALYNQTMQSSGTIVTVITNVSDADKVYGILESHEPVDLEERHAQYDVVGAYGAHPATPAPAAVPVASGTTDAKTEEVLSLSEETIAVRKRVVDRGTTRVRRYVVERPIEEQIRLRDETVSVFRRPVTVGATVGADAFTAREISVTETGEEAVVSKSTHVVEEVVVQKDVKERVETVRDTLRREEVEIAGPTTGVTTTKRSGV
ncbi:MAG: YsnF/AvaK domain-containing protein [Janthinobacterium lividum]